MERRRKVLCFAAECSQTEGMTISLINLSKETLSSTSRIYLTWRMPRFSTGRRAEICTVT